MEDNTETRDGFLQKVPKMFVIASIIEYIATLNAPRRHVIPPIYQINSQWSCHAGIFLYHKHVVNVKCDEPKLRTQIVLDSVTSRPQRRHPASRGYAATRGPAALQKKVKHCLIRLATQPGGRRAAEPHEDGSKQG